MKPTLSPRACRDLGEIARYVKAQNPVAALRIREAILASLRRLEAYPRAGRAMGGSLYRLTIPRLPYLIFYRIKQADDAVEIVTIRHAARQEEH